MRVTLPGRKSLGKPPGKDFELELERAAGGALTFTCRDYLPKGREGGCRHALHDPQYFQALRLGIGAFFCGDIARRSDGNVTRECRRTTRSLKVEPGVDHRLEHVLERLEGRWRIQPDQLEIRCGGAGLSEGVTQGMGKSVQNTSPVILRRQVGIA